MYYEHLNIRVNKNTGTFKFINLKLIELFSLENAIDFRDFIQNKMNIGNTNFNKMEIELYKKMKYIIKNKYKKSQLKIRKSNLKFNRTYKSLENAIESINILLREYYQYFFRNNIDIFKKNIL